MDNSPFPHAAPAWRGHLAPDDAGDVSPYGLRRGIDWRFIAATIQRRWLWIAAILALALAGGVVYTLMQPQRFTAQASVQINDQSDRVLREGEDLNRESAGYDDRYLATQIDILKSRGLALRVAQKLKLFTNDRFYRGMGATGAPTQASPAVRESTLGMLQGNLGVDLPYDSRIATIRFTSEDPALSADIANAFANEFIQSNLQRKYDSSSYARQFLADQLAETKTKLEASERALNNYARDAGLIRTRDALGGDDDKDSGGGGGSITTSSLVQLNSAANDAQAARFAAEARWREINAAPAQRSKEVLGNGTFQALRTQRASLQAKLQELRASHLDDYPGIAELKAQIAEIDRQMQATAADIKNSVQADYQAAVNSEKALQARVDALKGATLSEQDRSVQYNLLAREADTNRSLYDGLLQRYKELNAAAGVATSNIAIIDMAEPPLGPSSPNLNRNLAFSLLLGLLAATALVFLTVQGDDTIRVPEDVEAKLGLPLLGVVPSTGDPGTALTDPKSALSESYSSLRTALMHSTSEGLPPTLLVTSAQPGEGKTTTSRALAISLARLGKTVLLVDADLRRPQVHSVFGIGNERGLSSLLTSNESTAAAIVASSEPKLSLLPSGPLPPSPTELLSSMRLRALIDELAEKFDIVIIDSPPILGLADSPALSALVDGVAIVIEADRSRRGGLKSALRRLQGMRPILLGAVLTKFDSAHMANRYSEYYGTHHYEYRTKDAAA